MLFAARLQVKYPALSFTCKTLLSDSSPVFTSTFSKMHFLAVALVYAAADSSKDSDTLFTGEIKHKHITDPLATQKQCYCRVIKELVFHPRTEKLDNVLCIISRAEALEVCAHIYDCLGTEQL